MTVPLRSASPVALLIVLSPTISIYPQRRVLSEQEGLSAKCTDPVPELLHPWRWLLHFRSGRDQRSARCFLGCRDNGHHRYRCGTRTWTSHRTLRFAGPLSDKLGRRISTAIGSASYAIYLIGLAFAFNAGANGGYTIACIRAILGGIANSFLDTGIYPAVGEIIYKAPRARPPLTTACLSAAVFLQPCTLRACLSLPASGF